MIDAKDAAYTIALFCRLNTRARLTRPLRGGEIGLLVYLDSDETVHTSVAAASFFMISKAAISGLVKSLEQKGLIRREKSEADARQYDLFVTDEGKRIVKVVAEAYEKRVVDLSSIIGEDEFEKFIETMNKANDYIAEELNA
ncbi:MAG: MarR family transcriptional regulator [Mogibacterium sp.]|nr:MarR family transcriptional regulator [Mogibacterium sp.]